MRESSSRRVVLSTHTPPEHNHAVDIGVPYFARSLRCKRSRKGVQEGEGHQPGRISVATSMMHALLQGQGSYDR